MMRMSISRAALMSAAAIAAALAFTVTPASASQNHNSGVTIYPSGATIHGRAHHLSYCNWQGGTYICQYGITGPVIFPSGQEEYWVIGTDNAVWTYWNDVNGNWHWTSQGGYATSGVDVAQYGNGWSLIIDVWGYGHTSIWCKDRGDSQFSGWGNWYEC
jgi:hypothetical protein